MFKKIIIMTALIITAAVALTGCFDMSSLSGTSATTAPIKEKTFKSVDELTSAVATIKADTAATDEEGLKTLTYYYVMKALPEGAKISYVKVAKDVVRVGYEFGAASDETFDNKMELIWYRNQSADSFLTDVAKNLGTYDTISANGIDYLHATPTIQFTVTNAPDSTALATPTPRSATYCQFVYWVQDKVAYMAAVPLSFTKDDIGKYCVPEKVDLK
jgi:hypothetical protein